MGTGGNSGGFDIQKFFKTSNQPGYESVPTSYPPSSSPFPLPNEPNPFYSGSYSMLAASYPISSQGVSHHQYSSFSQERGPRPSPQYSPRHCGQPSFNQSSPSQLPQSLFVPGSAHMPLQQPAFSSPSGPSDNAQLMAILANQSASAPLEVPSSTLGLSMSDISQPSTAITAMPSAPPVSLISGRVGNNKVPRGRKLKGKQIVYDVDDRLAGEEQPQLEVSDITKYSSDPSLMLGRQIAVNKSYICYALRPNRHIRVLHMDSASRNLLRGHSQRVTDMVFFADDVHLLASASSDGRVFVRKIVEGLGDDGKPQITDHVLLGILFTGDWGLVHPRVCWHSHTQDVLVVGISNYVLTIHVPTVQKEYAHDNFTAEEPILCSIDSPIEGVDIIIRHEGEVTDVSMSYGAKLVSGSKDGRVWVWRENTMLSRFQPHDGREVGAVAFLSPPEQSDHAVVLTAGPLNRELKLWVPSGGDGWFPHSGEVNWKCIQTFELRSSSERRVEDAFFNQVLVVPKAYLIVLANARKNAIYALHVNFGSNPASTCIDYVAEFSMAIPILSLTARTEDVLDGEGVIQIYCVQTQAIQQHSLDLSMCLPPKEGPSVFSMDTDYSDRVCDSADKNISDTAYEVSSILRARSPGPISGVLLTGNVLPVVQVPDLPNLEASARTRNKEQVCDGADKNIADTMYEVSNILRAKSPGPISGVSLMSKPLPFVQVPELRNSEGPTITKSKESPTRIVEVMPASDGRAIIESSKKEMIDISRDLGSNLSQSLATVTQLGVQLSPRTPPSPRSRSRSPIDSTRIMSPGLPIDYFHSYEQSNEKKLDTRSVAMADILSPDTFPLSPRRVLDGLSTMDQQSIPGSMHLITPSELMSMVARAKVEGEAMTSSLKAVGTTDTGFNAKYESVPERKDPEVMDPETKQMTECTISRLEERGIGVEILPQNNVLAGEKSQMNALFGSPSTSDIKCPSVEDVKEEHTPPLMQVMTGDGIQRFNETGVPSERDQVLSTAVEEEQPKEIATKTKELSASILAQGRKKKNKNKTDVMGVPSSSFSQMPNVPVSTVSEHDSNMVLPPLLTAQLCTMQDNVNKLLTLQKDLQKQMSEIVTASVVREVKGMEADLGHRMEKVFKAHMEAMWARIQEDNARREKLEKERLQQLTSLVSNAVSKELPASLERALKKEILSLAPSIARVVTPSIEKAVTLAVNDSIQKGLVEKSAVQLEKSLSGKIETSLSKQLQAQFQSNGKQALQEGLRASLESSVVPSFERACQAMFVQVETALQNGVAEYYSHSQQQLVSSHGNLISTLQEALASASSLAASLKGDLAESQRKLLKLLETTGFAMTTHMPPSGNLPDKVMTVQSVEESLDPTKVLTRLIRERKLEEAFNMALSRADVSVVSWLCNQVDPGPLFETTPVPLSQGVILLLVQQLGWDLGNDTSKKLTWIREACLALNPHDRAFAPHMRQFLEQLYSSLHSLMSTALSPELVKLTRLVMLLVNSLLTSM